jgi:ABC-type nitrate/sulfonate/bicarbonate transport system substrate-binding protein
MIQSLQSKEIDVGIGLTEGWVAGLGKLKDQKVDKLPYSIVGTYVETPLCWAISTGVKRDDIKTVAGEGGLKGRKIGVSRIGSGSYVMGFVLADQNGWLESGSSKPPFEVLVLDTFKNLRDAVNDGTADFFMWEHFTSKRYYDNGEIRRVGEIYTPWSSWKIVTRDAKDERLEDMAVAINKGIEYFRDNQKEVVEYISSELDYSKEDAEEWLKTVTFAQNVRGVDEKVIQKTIQILGKAGVLDGKGVSAEEMIAIKRIEVSNNS